MKKIYWTGARIQLSYAAILSKRLRWLISHILPVRFANTLLAGWQEVNATEGLRCVKGLCIRVSEIFRSISSIGTSPMNLPMKSICRGSEHFITSRWFWQTAVPRCVKSLFTSRITSSCCKYQVLVLQLLCHLANPILCSTS